MLNSLLFALAVNLAPSVPSEVVGEWRWSSTGSLTNWNTTTSTYAGGGRGMSKHYVLRADGTFKQDSLIQIMNGSHRTSAFITAEGRYEIHGDNIKFTVVKGHQHGEDNLLSAGNYDRPMPKDVIERISETYCYVMRPENGKQAFVLRLTGMTKDDMIFFPVTSK